MQQKRYKLKVFYRDWAGKLSSTDFPCKDEEDLKEMVKIVSRHRFYVAHVKYYY